MLTTWFSLDPSDGTLTNDLALALIEAGHTVDVVTVEWRAPYGGRPRSVALAPGLNVLALNPRAITGLGLFVERATKWVFSPWAARRAMATALQGRSYDLLIGYSSAAETAAQILYAGRLARKSYLILWDFFPYHHRAIGLIGNPLVFALALKIENALMRGFDVVGVMTPANENCLRRKYRLRAGQKVEILPIWGRTELPLAADKTAVRAAFDLPQDKKIVVFGGTLSVGRGLDDILAAAEIAQSLHPELAFLIIGDGRLAASVEARAAEGGSNIHFRKRVPRARYLELLTACDVGLVCTVRDVDVPTFPSKTIDYLRAGIPIVASVEASTDYGAFIEANGLGRACLAGEPHALAMAAAAVAADAGLNAVIRARSREVLDRVFDVRKTVAQVTAIAMPTPAAAPQGPAGGPP